MVNRVWLLVLVATLSAGVLMPARASPAAEPIKIDLTQWTPPDIAMVGDDPFGKLVKYGHALFADTVSGESADQLLAKELGLPTRIRK